MSNAPGGFLPPLDPNPSGGTSSITRVVLTAALMLVAWTTMQIFGAKKDTPTPTTPATAQTTAAPSSTPNPASTLTEAPASTGTSNSLPETTKKFAADVAKATGSVDIAGGYDATLSSHGAQFSRFELTNYSEAHLNKKNAGDAPRVNLAKAQNSGARLGALRARAGGDVDLAADAPYEVAAESDTSVTYTRLTASGVRITRTYTFDPKTFAVTHELTLKNESTEKHTANLDLVLTGAERVGEREEGGMFSPATDRLGGHCDVDGDRHHFLSKKVQDDPEDFSWKGPVKTAGIDRHYFLAAYSFTGIPTEGCKASFFQTSTSTPTDSGKGIEIAVSYAPIPLVAGESKSFTQRAFIGPKQITILQAFGDNLEKAIDVGMLAILSRPLLWMLVHIQAQTHDYGLAIIGLTIAIFLLTLPLTHKSMVEMKKFGKVMKDLKPELDALKEKYGHDQRLMVEKQQAFFQSKGVNPFANMLGCLPLLVSMPVWMALYRTLSTSVELLQQPFPALGILDLTQPDGIIFGFPLLPFIVAGLMLFSTMQQPPPEDQPQMKYMMYGMPIFFLFIMFGTASGLSIYMITNSLLRMAQTYLIKRKYG